MNEKCEVLVGEEVKDKLTLADLEPTITVYVRGEQPEPEKCQVKIRQLLHGWALALENNNTIVLKKGNTIEGLARLTLKGAKDGHPIFEIENLYIEPASRGQGTSKDLRTRLLQYLSKKYPDAYVVSCTRQQRVKSVYDALVSRGIAEDIGHGTYLRQYTTEEISDEDIAREVIEGWKAYMYKVSDYLESIE